MAMNVRYPDFPKLSKISKEDQILIETWAAALIQTLKLKDLSTPQAANSKPFWIVTNVSINRGFAVSGATVSSTANALGTLLSDLKGSGYIA